MEDADPVDPKPDLTLALRELGAGHKEAAELLLPAIVTELRAVAQAYLGGRSASHTLQPTALVNETFLKLFGSQALAGVHDRSHFFALAARAMRQILTDHARAHRAAKCGGSEAPEPTIVDAFVIGGVARADDLLDVDSALTELARVDERQARLVELRYFAGLEVEEVAGVMEVSISTVEREWRAARAWLGRRLGDRYAQ